MSSRLKRKFSDVTNQEDIDENATQLLSSNSYHYNEVLPYVLTAVLSNNVIPELLAIIGQYGHIKDTCGLGVYVMSERPYDNSNEIYPKVYVLPTKLDCYTKGIMEMFDDSLDNYYYEIKSIMRQSIKKEDQDPIAVILRDWSHGKAKPIFVKITKVLSDRQLPLSTLKIWFDKLNEMNDQMKLSTYEITFKPEYDS